MTQQERIDAAHRIHHAMGELLSREVLHADVLFGTFLRFIVFMMRQMKLTRAQARELLDHAWDEERRAGR